MKLASLHIDRFGARSQLSLHELAHDLNVIYGPNGAGKSTIIQFIRWMLFGQHDEEARRYLATGDTAARGSVTIRSASATRTYERTSQSGALSHLVVQGTSQPASRPIAELSDAQFDRFFDVSFDRSRDISTLLSAASAHGFQLRYDQRQLDRIAQLTDQLNRHRGELSRRGHGDVSAESLHAQREEKRRQIETIQMDHQRRREELERRRHQVAAEVSEQHALVERLRSVLNNIDTSLSSRRGQLAEEYQHLSAARNEADEQRSRRVRELDQQIARWQEILVEIRQRLEHLRSRIASFGDTSVSSTDATDMRFFLRTLGFRIRDIEQDLGGIYEGETWRDYEADSSYLRGLLGSALNSMRDDVSRLCQTVERQHQANELHECREELSYLCRCEQELVDLVDALSRQRHHCGRESEFWPSGFATESVHWLTDPQTPTTVETAASLNDFRLRHLMQRRESAAARLGEAELELSNRQRQLREIEAELGRFGEDGRIAILQREIADIDTRLQQLQQREVLQQTITSLEEEIRRIRQQLGESEVVGEAATFLSRLTDNQYTSLRVTDDQRCHVTHRTGQVYDHTQLSRGVADQVYLSLCLAVVAGFLRRGVQAPLILNDVFINVDTSGTRAMAHTLADFARRGHQVLVFTRHQHVLQLFEPLAGRLFTLKSKDAWQHQPVPRLETPTPHDEPTYVAPRAEQPPTPAPDPTYRWVAEWHRGHPHPATPPSAPPPIIDPPAQEPPSRDDVDPPSNAYGLTLASPLTAVATLDTELAEHLHRLGIHRVDALLALDLDHAEAQLDSYGITAEIIQRRQREILMMLYVAVTPLEAQLLVTCGVPDPERLSRADENVLLRRVETILERPEAARRFGPAAHYTTQRIRGWIQTARASAYRHQTPRSFLGDALAAQSDQRSTRSSRSPSTAERVNSRRSAKRETTKRNTVRMRPSEGLRFYLELNDPVVDAPSIGPKMAERLHRIDIHTVANLLHSDTEDVAERLSEKRITPETVLQWQLQAQLVCRIPNLRGHDAQILVACGVDDPAQLTTLDASSFLKQVTQFVETKEGQRVLRNGKRPDLAEVTSWIEWSENARQLKAA